MWLSILAGVVCLIAAIPPIMIGVVGSVADWSAVGGAPEDSLQILPYVMRYLTPSMVAKRPACPVNSPIVKALSS